jgi:hypothetical protein
MSAEGRLEGRTNHHRSIAAAVSDASGCRSRYASISRTTCFTDASIASTFVLSDDLVERPATMTVPRKDSAHNVSRSVSNAIWVHERQLWTNTPGLPIDGRRNLAASQCPAL